MLAIAERRAEGATDAEGSVPAFGELAGQVRARAVEHGLTLREVRSESGATPGARAMRAETTGGRPGFPHLFFLRGAERGIESVARALENDERVIVQRAPAWRPVHPRGLMSSEPLARGTQQFDNKARRDCGFAEVVTPARRDDAPPIFVIDVGRPDHPQLNARVEYFGSNDPCMSSIVHGTRVCGIIAAEPNGHGFAGCCDAKLSFHNVVRKSAMGQIGFDFCSFYEALRKFYDSPSRILNLSMSADADDRIAQLIFRAVRRADKMIVVAMPSEGDASTFPASLSSVIGVGGINDVGDAAYDVAANCRALISAPGYKLDLLHTNGAFENDSGTSFAAPAVSAALWLALCERPTATHCQLRDALSHGVIAGALRGTVPDRARGFGRLHVPSMLQALSDIVAAG